MNRRGFLALLGLGGLAPISARFASSEDGSGPDLSELEARGDVEQPAAGYQRIVWSVDTDAPAAALTFDDGPDPEFTPAILQILDRFDVTATFFAMGYNAARHPRLLREVVAAGHEIGSHGWRHLNLTETDPEETRKEIELGHRTVEDHAEVPVRVFRPPYGRFSENAVRVLAPRPQDMVVWSVTRGKLSWEDPGLVAAHIAGSLKPGTIIDLHDGIGRGTFNPRSAGAERLRRRRETEIDALPRILERVRDDDLRLLTVSRLLAAGANEAEA